MANIVFKRKAIEDLNDIWEYTFFEWSEKQADFYYSEIKKACADIAKKPLVGKEYSAINKNLLGYKSGKHIIFYFINPEKNIEVVRILHERMDLKNRIIDKT